MLKNKKISYLKNNIYLIFFSFILLCSVKNVQATTLLSDDFTGTTIDTAKWVEYDAAGSGGSSGNIQQNNALTVQNSGDGTTALVSLDSFSADSLELSATISYGGLFLFGYGDREWSLAGNKAYLIYQTGGNILGLAWNNHVLNKNVACGSATSGATYKMKIIPTGFEIYKNDVLACTVTPTSENLVDNKTIFLESNNAGVSTFDNVLVTGISDEEVTVPDAPTIGTATAGNTQATVSFTPGSSSGSPITGYTVTSNPGSITATGSSSPIIVTGLTNGVEYTFTVTATNAIGTSASSSPSNAVTPSEGAGILDTADLWFQADEIVGLNDGDSVTTWEDSSVSNLDFTQSTANKKPIYKTNIINSKPIVRFDGVDDLLITPSTSNSTGITVFSVVKSADTSGGYFLWLGGNNNAIVHGYSGETWEYYNSPRTVIGSISTSEFQIITSRVGSSLTGSVSLGADSGTIAPWAGDVAELIIYKSVLSNDDYNTVVDYLNAKYFVLSEPGAPTDLIATPSSEQMLLSWTAPVSNGGASITDYLVEYKLSSTSTWSIFSDGVSTSTSIVVTNLTNDLSYNFRVSAINSVGTGDASDVATGTPALSIPTAPINLLATPGSNQITLSWVAPVSNGGASITDYLVEYKLSSTSTWSTFSDGVSTSTSAVVNNLTNDISYNFRVSATNSVGTGNASNVVTSTPALSVPTAPINLLATPGSNQITLSWVAPVSNGGASITDYLVEYKLSSTSTWSTFSDGVSTSTSSVVTDLTNSVSYNFRVSAINSVGTGPVSDTVTSTPDYVLLSDDFTGTTIDTNKWTEVDTGGIGGETGNVQQNESLTVANSESGTNEGINALVSNDSFDANGLEISAKLTYGGLTIFGYGDRQWNLVGNRAYFIYFSGGNVGGLTWYNGAYDTSASNLACGAIVNGATYKMKIIETGFEIYKNGVLQCTITPTNPLALVDDKPIFLESNGATASTFDDVYVIGTYTPPSAPSAPTGVTAVSDNAMATVSFTPGASGGSPITGYTVTSNPGSITATGSSSPIVVTGLTNGVEYTFTVIATNAIGASASSSPSNAVTPTVPDLPEQVTGLEATGVNKQVLLSWDEPDDGGAPISDYLIEYKISSSTPWSIYNHSATTTLKAIVRGLVNSTEYNFRVSAVNSGGAGTASETVTSTPRALTELVFVFNGESNSGGQAHNNEATVEELSSTSEVQILNNTTFVFENLDIGTNNNIDHCCWLNSATQHGFELCLANSVKADTLPDNPQVHLIKTGQGGSRFSQWNVGGTYWNKFLERVNAAKTQLPEDRQWVTWISIGINDYLAGTTVPTFKTQLIAHINKIKVELPGTIIILTQFQSMGNGGYATYNTVMDEIAATESNVYVVNSTGADMDDGNHWSYDGLKTVGDRMIVVTKSQLGLIYPGIPTDFSVNFSTTTADLSWTAPISNGGAVITDYLIEYKDSASSIWSTFDDGVSVATSTTVTGLSDNSDYNFRVSAINANGSGNTIAVNGSTTDGTDPTISNTSATPTSTQATITWTTNEESSSKVDYGLTDTYTESTIESDTVSRVTNHEVIISDLLPCTNYHYRVRSSDASSNEAMGIDNIFTTLGCIALSDIIASSTEEIATTTGGTLNLYDNDSNGLTLTIPANFASSTTSFQANQLDPVTVFASISTPSGFSSIGDYLYQLQALSGVSTTITTFDVPISITITYDESSISGLDTSSLRIYRFDGLSWHELSNCSINTTLRTVTCETTQFSTFGLFGETISSNTNLPGSTIIIIPETKDADEEMNIAKDRWVKTKDSKAVYFVDVFGIRHAYPNQAVWESYFGKDFSSVVEITKEELTSYPLGKNVTYKENVLIKIPSVPKVYTVTENKILRWITSEDVAKRLYGNFWNKLVHDLDETFFGDYRLGEDLK